MNNSNDIKNTDLHGFDELYTQCIIENALHQNDIKTSWKQLRYDIESRPYLHDNILLMKQIPPANIAFDIGCAFGTTSLFLKKLGWKRVRSLDAIYKISDYIQDVHKIEFSLSDIELSDIPDGNDLIIFTEILEHLRINPLGVMEKIHDALNEDGFLILSTPNLDSEFVSDGIFQDGNCLMSYKTAYSIERHLNKQESYNALKDHFFVYNKYNLENLLHDAGFHITTYLEKNNLNIIGNIYVVCQKKK